MYEITTESSFSAAHKLLNYSGPCENIHGHNWLVKATVRCTKLDKSGIGIDFKKLREHLRSILDKFDHKDLNVVLEPFDLNPSSENLAKFIYEQMKACLSGSEALIYRVEVFESHGNGAAYFE